MGGAANPEEASSGWEGPSLGGLKPPFRLGHYLVIESLAKGGMGEVFIARHSAGLGGVERLCVIKTIRADRGGEYERRFLDEANVVVRLAHRNICQVFEVGEVERRFFLSMEYVPGLDVRRLMQEVFVRGEVVGEDLATYVMGEVLEALEYAHRSMDPATGRHLGIVHRDVSPQNVLVSFEGEVKLIDFGLAVSELKLEKTAPRFVMGKLQYMSPEQARGKELDGRCDMFAAGVMLYEMLAGERFYAGVDPSQLFTAVGRGGFEPRRLGALSRAYQEVIRRAVAIKPEDRFADCGAFKDAMVAARLESGMPGNERRMRDRLQELLGAEEANPTSKIQRYMSAEFASEVSEEKTGSIRIAATSQISAFSSTGSNEAAAESSALRAANEATVVKARPVDDPTLELAPLTDSDVATVEQAIPVRAAPPSIEPTAVIVRQVVKEMPPAPRRRRPLMVAIAATFSVVVGGLLLVLVGPSDADDVPVTPPPVVEPSSADQASDGARGADAVPEPTDVGDPNATAEPGSDGEDAALTADAPTDLAAPSDGPGQAGPPEGADTAPAPDPDVAQAAAAGHNASQAAENAPDDVEDQPEGPTGVAAAAPRAEPAAAKRPTSRSRTSGRRARSSSSAPDPVRSAGRASPEPKRTPSAKPDRERRPTVSPPPDLPFMKAKWLKKHCQRVSCTKATLAAYEASKKPGGDGMAASIARVDVCAARCWKALSP